MSDNEKHAKPKGKPVPKLDQITSLSSDHRRELLASFAKMTDKQKFDVLDLQRFLIRQHLETWKSCSALALGTLVEALSKRVATESVLTRKESDGDPDRLLKMRVQAMQRDRREGAKEKTYRTRFHSLVCDLRGLNLGWRKCAEYLKKYHRFDISYSRLKILFQKYSNMDQHNVID
jgi:hypothetical protein